MAERYWYAVSTHVDQNLAAFQSALGNSSTPLLADEIGLYGQSALGIPNTGDPTYISGISWQRGMYRAIKTAAMYDAGGAQAVMPHVLYISTSNVSSNEEIYGYEAGDRGPHPKTSAFLMTSYWLNGRHVRQLLYSPAPMYSSMPGNWPTTPLARFLPGPWKDKRCRYSTPRSPPRISSGTVFP